MNKRTSGAFHIFGLVSLNALAVSTHAAKQSRPGHSAMNFYDLGQIHLPTANPLTFCCPSLTHI